MSWYNFKTVRLYKLTCPSCGKTVELSQEGECRYDFIQRLKAENGWTHTGDSFVCKSCSSQKRKSLF